MLRSYVAWLRGALEELRGLHMEIEVKGALDGQKTEDKRRPVDRCATPFDWKAEDSINAARRGARRGRRARRDLAHSS